MRTDSLTNIVDVFINAAQAWPDSIALVHNDEHITYAGLLIAVQKTAGSLQARGVRKGDAVLLAVPMSIELYTVVLALFYAGAVPVFLDAWVGRKRMAECLATVPCTALIAPRKLLWISLLFSALRRFPLKSTPAALLGGEILSEPAQVNEIDTALITFTTGSTGRPKATNRTHRFLYAQLDALRPILPPGREVSFTTLPIVVLLHLAMGKATVLPPSSYSMKQPRSIRHLYAAIQSQEIATMVVSPSVMVSLTRLEALPGLRRIITGGGPVFPDLARHMTDRYPQAGTTVVFGSTEAEPISHVDAAELANTNAETMQKWGLPVGLPDAAASVRIIRWQGEAPLQCMTTGEWNATSQPVGDWGEIAVSGAHVLKHYINNPAAEAVHKVQIDGVTWHRTGDAGRMDCSGRLYFAGRCTEVIEWNGQPVFPVVVACQLMEKTGVTGAAILLINDRLTAVIESGEKLPPPSVAVLLADYGVAPVRIICMKKLPRDPRHLTKIDYAALRKKLKQ